MENTATRLRLIMREKNLKQVELLEMYNKEAAKQNVKGIGHSALCQYISGKILPRHDKIYILGLVLDVSEAWLMGYDVPRDVDTARNRAKKAEAKKLPSDIIPITKMEHHRVPLIGSVAAGEPIYEPEDYGVYIDAPDKADYALRVSGDSMMPMFLDGDVIYIHAQDDVDNGVVGVVLEDDSYCVKHIYHTNRSTLLLVSENSNYPPRTITASEDNPIRILGKVCGYTRMFR